MYRGSKASRAVFMFRGNTEVRLPVLLSPMVRALASEMVLITDSRHVTQKLTAFHDHRLSFRMSLFVDTDMARMTRISARDNAMKWWARRKPEPLIWRFPRSKPDDRIATPSNHEDAPPLSGDAEDGIDESRRGWHVRVIRTLTGAARATASSGEEQGAGVELDRSLGRGAESANPERLRAPRNHGRDIPTASRSPHSPAHRQDPAFASREIKHCSSSAGTQSKDVAVPRGEVAEDLWAGRPGHTVKSTSDSQQSAPASAREHQTSHHHPAQGESPSEWPPHWRARMRVRAQFFARWSKTWSQRVVTGSPRPGPGLGEDHTVPQAMKPVGGVGGQVPQVVASARGEGRALSRAGVAEAGDAAGADLRLALRKSTSDVASVRQTVSARQRVRRARSVTAAGAQELASLPAGQAPGLMDGSPSGCVEAHNRGSAPRVGERGERVREEWLRPFSPQDSAGDVGEETCSHCMSVDASVEVCGDECGDVEEFPSRELTDQRAEAARSRQRDPFSSFDEKIQGGSGPRGTDRGSLPGVVRDRRADETHFVSGARRTPTAGAAPEARLGATRDQLGANPAAIKPAGSPQAADGVAAIDAGAKIPGSADSGSDDGHGGGTNRVGSGAFAVSPRPIVSWSNGNVRHHAVRAAGAAVAKIQGHNLNKLRPRAAKAPESNADPDSCGRSPISSAASMEDRVTAVVREVEAASIELPQVDHRSGDGATTFPQFNRLWHSDHGSNSQKLIHPGRQACCRVGETRGIVPAMIRPWHWPRRSA